MTNLNFYKINFKITAYHPLLSASPLHNVSVLTFRSISFFHNMPSEITLYHSLQTTSAEHSESASKYDKMLSATWSNPFSVHQTITSIKFLNHANVNTKLNLVFLCKYFCFYKRKFISNNFQFMFLYLKWLLNCGSLLVNKETNDCTFPFIIIPHVSWWLWFSL